MLHKVGSVYKYQSSDRLNIPLNNKYQSYDLQNAM